MTIQKPIVVRFHPAVALTGSILKAFDVSDLDASSAIANETSLLVNVSHRRHAAPLYSKHLREKLLCERQRIAARQISRPQQPAGQPGFDRVRSIARGRLLGLYQEE